jgi:hypothetical protein
MTFTDDQIKSLSQNLGQRLDECGFNAEEQSILTAAVQAARLPAGQTSGAVESLLINLLQDLAASYSANDRATAIKEIYAKIHPPPPK